MQVREEARAGQEIAQLLQQHLEAMQETTPPGSVHALDFEGLQSADMTFWSVWDGDEILGCGALKKIDAGSGEIKSMRTAAEHRRKGVGAAILDRIIEEAIRRDYDRLYLETGSQTEFAPARALYERDGFRYCRPFTCYVDDPNSVFMVKALDT
jgi:putative acetyltransferase